MNFKDIVKAHEEDEVSKLTTEELRSVLHYNPDTGIFTWVGKGHKRRASAIAGGVIKDGYVGIRINYVRYLAHRLAWLYTYNKWPDKPIDHINGDPKDNRIINLREATDSENQRNSKRRKDNVSGIKGVAWNNSKKKWQALIRANYKAIFVGYYDDINEAARAVRAAREKHHGKFANHGTN